jgi:hypothetical protein
MARHTRHTRKNPPLSQHMAEEDLSDISELLGPRLHADPSEGAEFVRDCLRFVASGVGDRPAMGEYERQREIKQHLQMAQKALGDALAIMHTRRNFSASHGSVPELAHEFSRILRDWLTEDEIEQVIERNAEFDDPAVCASHDFCDANMAMYEAFENIMGHPIDTRKKADASVWDKAWNMAKASNFAVGPRANPARHPREMSKAEDDAAFVAAMIRAGYSEKEAAKHLVSYHRSLEEGDEAFMLRAGAARRIRDLSES